MNPALGPSVTARLRQPAGASVDGAVTDVASALTAGKLDAVGSRTTSTWASGSSPFSVPVIDGGATRQPQRVESVELVRPWL